MKREFRPDGETSEVIEPIGKYLNNISKAYKANYKWKHYKTVAKPRRDIGSQRDMKARAARRVSASQPMELAEFKRVREASINEVENLPEAERARKRARLGVPQDSGKFETPKSKDLREKAEQRGAKKARRYSVVGLDVDRAAPKKKAQRRKHRWAGLDRDSAAGSETPAADGKTSVPQAVVDNKTVMLLMPRPKHPSTELLLRRGFCPAVNLFSYAKHVLSPAGAAKAVIVLDRLAPACATTNIAMIFGRVLGGFITTEGWLHRATESNKPPQGFQYKGIVKRNIEIGMSPGLANRHPKLHALFKSLDEAAASTIVFHENIRMVQQRFNELFKEKGKRSKPALRATWLCLNEADVEIESSKYKLEDPVKDIVQPSDVFLRNASKAGQPVCPGNWKS